MQQISGMRGKTFFHVTTHAMMEFLIGSKPHRSSSVDIEQIRDATLSSLKVHVTACIKFQSLLKIQDISATQREDVD